LKAIIITTINVPQNIYEFMEKADSEWLPIIVGDTKTPHDEVEKVCRDNRGIYLSPERQKTLGFTHGEALPWGCYDRKNLGYLFALREGAEIVYSTDDDNFPPEHWDSYAKLGKQRIKAVSSESGWWNCFSLGNTSIKPRGYPVWLFQEEDNYTYDEREMDVAIQMGLCGGDPDIDAMTRLVLNPRIETFADEDVALEVDTMCPYNTQNTFISREMLPANMLWCGAQTTVYRYDDIFAGYVGQVIARYHGKTVKFGRPHLHQERNQHDHLKDIKSELGGMLCQERFLSILRNIDFREQRIADNLRQIVYTVVNEIEELPEQFKTYVDTWCDDLEKIGL
jgi:hypothetical protein